VSFFEGEGEKWEKWVWHLAEDQPRVEEEEKGEEDEVEECRDKCNQQLRMGLDMVKVGSTEIIWKRASSPLLPIGPFGLWQYWSAVGH
jgi:hypothetical protein